MATLAGSTIASTYTYLLKMDGTSGLTSSLVAVQDGDATDSALKISTTSASVAHTVTTAASTPIALLVDANTSGDAAQNSVGLHVDFDRTVAGASTNAHNDIGINLDVNSASLGTSSVIGMDIDVVGATSGTSTATGLAVTVGSADTNYAAVFSGGNVGIGTDSPVNMLEIDTGGVADKGLDIMDGAATAATLRDAAGSSAQVGILSLYTTGGTENARIRGDLNSSFIMGNLGLGDSSPDYRLEVYDTDAVVAEFKSNNANYTAVTIENTGSGGDRWYIIGTASSHASGGGNLTFYNEDQTKHVLFLDESGKVGIGESEMAPDAYLTINQGADDGLALSCKSSDVGHNVTNVVEADTYGYLGKHSGTNGGFRIGGVTQYSYGAIHMDGIADIAALTAKSAGGGYGIVTVDTSVEDSNTSGAVGSNGNMFAISNNDSVRFIIDAEGEIHADGGTSTDAVTVYDEYDDAQLVRSLDISYGHESGLIDSKFDEFIDYNHEKLAELNLVGREEDGSPNHFINVTGMQRLHNGAIWQQYTEMQKMKELMYDTMVEMFGKEKADSKLKDHDIKLLDNKTLLN